MKNAFLSPLLLSFLLLSACGSSDDNNGDESFDDSYLQFYNGSGNSASTIMGEVDGNVLGSATYGDATSLITGDNSEVELEFYRIDADDQEVTIEERTVDLTTGEKVLIIMSGDNEAPSFTENRYDREDLEDHFRLFATSVIVDSAGYDLYMGEAGEPFSEANLLDTVTYEQFDELAFWNPDNDNDDFDEGEYILYLTEAGSSDPFFESATISFAFDTEYVLALRETSGAIQDTVVIDLIINSSSVSNYADEDATSQYRIYNSLDDSTPVSLSLAGNGDTSDDFTLDANTLSDFKEVDFGDYRLTATLGDDGFNNRLVTLNQGESKAVVLYRDDEEALNSISFEESSLPQVFDHQIQIVNLAPDYFDIDFYFVRSDETIESAEYQVAGLDYEESRSITLPSDFYELIAVFDDSNETQVLLDRTELIGINEEVNYIITVEKTDDSDTGFQISLLY